MAAGVGFLLAEAIGERLLAGDRGRRDGRSTIGECESDGAGEKPDHEIGAEAADRRHQTHVDCALPPQAALGQRWSGCANRCRRLMRYPNAQAATQAMVAASKTARESPRHTADKAGGSC